MAQTWRFASQAGQTLQGELCLEGSTMLVTVNDGATPIKSFRCHRRTGNHNECQRLF